MKSFKFIWNELNNYQFKYILQYLSHVSIYVVTVSNLAQYYDVDIHLCGDICLSIYILAHTLTFDLIKVSETSKYYER